MVTMVLLANLLKGSTFTSLLPTRERQSHKGDFGHVLVIGGGRGMPGAVHLVAKAALRTGAGAVTIATWPDYAKQALSGLPEAMVYGIEGALDLLPLIKRATVCVIGPGLGESEWGIELFKAAIKASLPMVVDASALRILASMPQPYDHWILTPHPGEAASLLHSSVEKIQSDRMGSLCQLQKKYKGTIVLKGANTLIGTKDDGAFICGEGNPGMATAGMGDVLSGVIAGLLAQHVSLDDAAKLGVWLHANAADCAVFKKGERGLLASDLMPYLRQLVNGHF